MNHDQKIEKELHKCPKCGLHYEDKAQAKKCEVWCRKHHSCNLEITSQAIESKQNK